MGVIFRKKHIDHVTYDQFDTFDRSFSAMIVCDEIPGSEKSIQGGRITYFMMTEEDLPAFDWKALCLFKDGVWEQPIPDGDEDAQLAATFFIDKWNRELLKHNLKDEDFCKTMEFGNSREKHAY